jgi:hypothetical protein
MSNDDFQGDTQSEVAEPEPDSPEESPQAATAEELGEAIDKSHKNDDIAQVVEDVLRAQQFANVYISHTSIESVAGPVHSGSGHIKYSSLHETGTASPLVLGAIVKDDIDRIQAVYVKPPEYDAAHQVLSKHHLLILQGNGHWGKHTTAVHLLAALSQYDIYEISPVASVSTLLSHSWQQNQAYVVDTMSLEHARDLTETNLSGLSRKLAERKSRLVITVDSGAVLPSAVVASYAVVCREIANLQDLLHTHLSRYIEHSDGIAKASDLCASPEVLELLDGQLLPRDIDTLADLISRVVGGSLTLEQALSRFVRNIEGQVRDWFQNNTELDDRTLMIALSVLNGAPESLIFEAEERLRSSLAPAKAETDATDRSRFFFGRTTDQRIHSMGAQPKASFEQTELGRIPIRLIEFDNPLFQPVILRFCWLNYDRLREPLVSWLHRLGLHPSIEVRARAAAAAGELSKYDVAYLRGQVLLPWAKHEKAEVRRATAFALGVPAWESAHAPHVLKLLHHWSTLKNNWRLSWTAAAAYGGLVGLRFPGVALDDLRTIAALGDVRLLDVIASSVGALFEGGRYSRDYYSSVLAALQNWAQDKSTEAVSVTGTFAFLDICANSSVDSDPPEGKWPTVLWLIGESPSTKETIVALWRQALNVKATRELALETLRYWLKAVEDDHRVYNLIEMLIHSIWTKGSGREGDRLRFYLRRWSPSVNAAAKMLAADTSPS